VHGIQWSAIHRAGNLGNRHSYSMLIDRKCIHVLGANVQMANDEFYTKKWNSFDEFDNNFKEFCANTKQVFSVIDLRPMAYQNARLREGKGNH